MKNKLMEKIEKAIETAEPGANVTITASAAEWIDIIALADYADAIGKLSNLYERYSNN